MKILFVVAKHPENPSDSYISKDLIQSLYEQGNDVTVVTLLEKKFSQSTRISTENGYDVLRVRTGDLFDTVTLFQKFISTITLPYRLFNAIKNNFSSRNFDLVVTHTPFLANKLLINRLKKMFGCKSLLLVWDIFPQNAYDLGLIRSQVLFGWLKYRERKMLKAFDYLNCMSIGNKEYILDKHPYLNSGKLFVNYNWAYPLSSDISDSSYIKKKYGYKESDMICVFGGNLGRPQKMKNVLKLATSFSNVSFLIIGRGTEFFRVKKASLEIDNLTVLDYIPRNDYEQLIAACDVGLISLDERFTVPNFPSKTTDYMKCGLPIFALLDDVSADDYGIFIRDIACAGDFILAKNIPDDFSKFNDFIFNADGLSEKSKNSKIYFEKFLNVKMVSTALFDALNL